MENNKLDDGLQDSMPTSVYARKLTKTETEINLCCSTFSTDFLFIEMF